jgi:hypothetical protein
MTGKLFKVLVRGIVAVIIVPILFYILKGFIGTDAVNTMVAAQPALFAFVIETAIPLGYLVMAIIWTFMPVFQEDRPENSMAAYVKNSSIWRR